MSNARACWFDGAFVDGGVPLFDAFDPALLLGDGIFESFAISFAPAPWLGEHERRLRWAAGRLGFEVPSLPEWEPLLQGLLERAGLHAGRARITLLGPAQSPRVLVTLAPLPEDLKRRRREGIVLASSPYRLGPDDPGAGLKLASRAFYLAAEREAQARGADDALLLGEHGELRECTRWNVFVQEPSGQLHTPTITGAFLPGIARARVLRRLAADGIPAREGTVLREEIGPAQAIFVTNSVHGVVPVRTLDGVSLAAPHGLERLHDVFAQQFASSDAAHGAAPDSGSAPES